MKLLFKQRIFTWFDKYDIYDEAGNTIFTVKGQLSWGHCLKIYNSYGEEIGTVKEKIFTLLPKFELYSGSRYLGRMSKEFTLFKQCYNLDFNGWHVKGDLWGWNYTIFSPNNTVIATVSKQLFRIGDTYCIEVVHPENALVALMFVLAIDAEKCTRQNSNC